MTVLKFKYLLVFAKNSEKNLFFQIPAILLFVK